MLWTRIRSSIRALWKRSDFEHNMADEMEFHIQARADDLMVRRRLSHEAALRQARLEFGSTEKYREESREARGLWVFDQLWNDTRYSFGQLRKYRSFTAAAILTIALGIGINTAMFTLINGTLFKPLPVRSPEEITRLATVSSENRIPSAQISMPDYRDYREESDAFEDMAAWSNEIVPLSVDNRTDRVLIGAVSGNYFSLLGVHPALGRLIRPADGELGGTEPIAVLRYAYWANQFAGDPTVIGKQIKLKGQPFTIAGVVQESFRGTEPLIDVGVYIPLEFSEAKTFATKRDLQTVRVIARLKPGIHLDQAQASLDTISSRLQQSYPESNSKRRMRVFDERAARPDPGVVGVMPMITGSLLLLSGVVLLVASINVLSLFLARGLARREEMAMRAALGASRWQLIRVCLVEAFLISAIGGVAGIAAASWATRSLQTVRPRGFEGIALGMDLTMDWRVLAYSAVLIILTALIVGLIPALRSARTSPRQDLHGNRSASPARRQRFRQSLVAAQLALSVAFLIVAGMFIESLHNLAALDLGFRRDHMLLVDIDPTGAGYSDTRISFLYKNIEARLRSIPGVQEVSDAALKPFGDSVMSLGVSAEGPELSSAAGVLPADANYVSEGYFHTMEIPLLNGRVFEESDATSRRIAVISDNMATRLWPGEDAVGKHFRTSLAANALFEVIGVVKASKQREGLQPRRRPAPQVFFYAGQSLLPMPRTLYIRTLTDPEKIAASVQSDIRSIDANLAIPNVVSMEEQVRRSPTGFAAARITVIISAVLGCLILALALVGTFGSLWFMVGQRTQEIGIRMALGAKRSAVLKMIIGHGLLLASVGTVGGILLGAEIGNALQLFLFDVPPSDPLILVCVALLLLSTAFLTCLLPARRATRIDPILALKCE